MKKTPLQQVTERFETKEKLVEAVEQLATDELWIDRFNETKGLMSVSNQKLLRLHDILTEVKKEFGSRDKLIAQILELENRVKDTGLKNRYAKYPTPRLLEAHRAASKRAKAAQAKAAKAKPSPTKKKVARSKKAQAKARASA
jgi:hypothetical protein